MADPAASARHETISNASAMPWPPPMHKVTKPRRRPSRRIEWMRRVVRTAPVAPIGFRQAELARHDDGDGCERLVDLDSLDVAEPPPGAVQRLTHRRDRAEAEHARLDSGDPVRYEAGDRIETAAFRPILICQHHRGSAAVEARRIAGGDRPVPGERLISTPPVPPTSFATDCARRCRKRSAPYDPGSRRQ